MTDNFEYGFTDGQIVLAKKFAELYGMIDYLKNERDQARKELIAYDAIHGKMSVAAAAKARGWGYLIKENKIV